MGWAEGLQSGMQLGNLINQGLDRRALAEEAKKHQVTEIDPDQYGLGASIDAALRRKTAEGVTPDQVNTAPELAQASYEAGLAKPRYAYGDQTFTDRAAAELAASQGRAMGMANVYRGLGDEEKASTLEARALQNRAALAQTKGLERTEREQAMDEARKGEDKAWWETRLKGEDGKMRAPTSEDMLAAAQRGVASHYQSGNFDKGIASYNQYMDLAEKQILSQERERKRDGEKAFAAVMAGDLKSGMDFYNKYLPNGSIATDAKLDPKTGMITVAHTDMNGKKLPDTQISRQQLLEGISSFGDSKQALAYVQQSFMNNIHTQELGIKRKSVEQTGQYYQARIAAEKMGTAQTFNDEKGDTYMVVPTMGPRGLSFETTKVNPDGAHFRKPGGAGDKPVKIEEEGTKMSLGGKTVVADGNGNWIPADGNGRPIGILPSERTKVLKEAGVPDNLVGQIPWNKTGTGILFNGKEYDPKDPKDLKTMVETYKRLGAAEIGLQEATARDVALQQSFRGLGGSQPGLYQDPDLWDLYHNRSRNQGLIPRLPQ